MNKYNTAYNTKIYATAFKILSAIFLLLLISAIPLIFLGWNDIVNYFCIVAMAWVFYTISVFPLHYFKIIDMNMKINQDEKQVVSK